MHGVHGRRQAGPGETFWQFRPFVSGEPAARVDWRRSAREDRAFVREREWEAAHTRLDLVRPLAFDGASPRTSRLRQVDRATVLALALADLAVRGGERAGLIGLTRPLATRGVIERFAEAIAADERLRRAAAGLPPPDALRARARRSC